ncbi:MAG: MerR family transcriptional regulator [Myxococcota bacterium]
MRRDFGVREAAQILGLSERQIRSYVQDGFLDTARGPRGEHRFGFQELVLLRTARELLAADVTPRKVRRALLALRARLPAGVPLSGVHIALEGEELVVRDGNGPWVAESGQRLFDFSTDEILAQVAPLETRLSLEVDMILDLEDLPDNLSVLPVVPGPPDGPRGALDPEDRAAEMRCADWMEVADAFRDDERLTQARDALRRALECDPFEPEARRELVRLLEQDGRLDMAEVQSRLLRRLHPRDAEAALDHGRLLVQMGELEPALEAFQHARATAPRLREAWVGAADVLERLGRTGEARALREDRPTD